MFQPSNDSTNSDLWSMQTNQSYDEDTTLSCKLDEQPASSATCMTQMADYPLIANRNAMWPQLSAYSYPFTPPGSQELLVSGQMMCLSQEFEIAQKVKELETESSGHLGGDLYETMTLGSKSRADIDEETSSTLTRSNHQHDSDPEEEEEDDDDESSINVTSLSESEDDLPADLSNPNQADLNSSFDCIMLQSQETRDFVNENINFLQPLVTNLRAAVKASTKQPQRQQQKQQKPTTEQRKPLANIKSINQQPHDLSNRPELNENGANSLAPTNGNIKTQEESNTQEESKITPGVVQLSITFDEKGGVRLAQCALMKRARVASPKKPRQQTCKPRDCPEPKRRRSVPRVQKTPHQLDLLHVEFERCQYPSRETRKSLTKETGLTDNQVRLWFQYQRRLVQQEARL